MILNEFFYKYPYLQLLIHYRLSYVAITNSVTTTSNQYFSSRKISRMKMSTTSVFENIVKHRSLNF